MTSNVINPSKITPIETDNGTVLDYQQNDVLSFKSIPFSTPLLGLNRWRPPQPSGYLPHHERVKLDLRSSTMGWRCASPLLKCTRKRSYLRKTDHFTDIRYTQVFTG